MRQNSSSREPFPLIYPTLSLGCIDSHIHRTRTLYAHNIYTYHAHISYAHTHICYTHIMHTHIHTLTYSLTHIHTYTHTYTFHIYITLHKPPSPSSPPSPALSLPNPYPNPIHTQRTGIIHHAQDPLNPQPLTQPQDLNPPSPSFHKSPSV